MASFVAAGTYLDSAPGTDGGAGKNRAGINWSDPAPVLFTKRGGGGGGGGDGV